MRINKLYLRNFRNYVEESFLFSSGINFIYGLNAQGKTNLLEALFLVSTGRSFRTSYLKELIREQSSFFFVEAEFEKESIQQKIQLSFDGTHKKLELNRTNYAHFNPLLGLIPIVMLAPEDVLLMTGAPLERRRFLDLHLAQSDPLYVFHATRYHKAIKHRNVLLKQKTEEGLEPWETLMLTASKYIQHKRAVLLQELKDELLIQMGHLSQNQDFLEIRYTPSICLDYAKQRSKEFVLGSTLLGPHRDDFSILINHKSAAEFASQGQLRSAVAALRLAQWKNLADKHGLSPLFCIDDFGVHLDEERREFLLQSLDKRGQIFLTSPFPIQKANYHSLEIKSGTLNSSYPIGCKI